MDVTFGARLRMRREEQQIPLTTIAERTKISLALLEGLERDDLSRWPRGIFRRSYFRDYVQAIGLNPDSMLPQFQELYPDSEDEVTEALAKVRLGDTVRRPPTRLRCLLDSAVNAALRLQTAQQARPGAAGQPGGPAVRRPAPSNQSDPFITPAPHPITAPQSDSSTSPIEVQPEIDFSEVAQLCTRLACAAQVGEVTAILAEAATELNTVGLSLWVRHPLSIGLVPVFASGYTDETISQLPLVSRDADNAIALAFRAAEVRSVEGDDLVTGALVVPLLTATGCTGVLALEFRQGLEQRDAVRAAATLLAAQLSALLGEQMFAEAASA